MRRDVRRFFSPGIGVPSGGTPREVFRKFN
jgi:hypothetical protein